MFEPKQVPANLKWDEFLQFEGFVRCCRVVIRISIVLKDGFLEFGASRLSEEEHWVN